ncbi:MAG: terminase family protein, partial [Thermoguttaceae bacterium]
MNAHAAIMPEIGPETIQPQPGPQTDFLSSSADIAIYGGSAGGGKSWALLLEDLRHIGNPGFGSVTFRRSTVQIRNEGGLWDESAKLYPLAGGDPREHVLTWKWPSGATSSFAHLEHDKTRFNWQGSQIPLIKFDELTHFTATQFWYMVSRNRSMCGVRPYIRATCNPDADSWVAELIEWWIDQDTGLPIPERSGKLRWFVRVGEVLKWADSPDELACYTMVNDAGEQVPIPPKSLTFIPAKLTDNKALMAADPGYMASLLALPLVERERLLGGNWKIRPAAGLYFQRSWCRVVDAAPAGTVWGRGYDLAVTPPTPENPDPDFLA